MCGNVNNLLATRGTRKSFCRVRGQLRIAVQFSNIALRSQITQGWTWPCVRIPHPASDRDAQSVHLPHSWQNLNAPSMPSIPSIRFSGGKAVCRVGSKTSGMYEAREARLGQVTTQGSLQQTRKKGRRLIERT